MNGDSGNRTPETMANRSPDDRCVWTRMPDDEQRWMQPVRFYLACADEIARGRYPFYRLGTQVIPAAHYISQRCLRAFLEHAKWTAPLFMTAYLASPAAL